MPCQRCIDGLQEAGRILQEMAYCDPDALPAGRDWAQLGVELLKLAGHLRQLSLNRSSNDGGDS